MGITAWVLVFVISLAVLIKACGSFIQGAEAVGRAMGLPSFVIGVVLVATGTSLPELVSSLVAVYQGSSEIVIGNVLGSNITNIFLVLGLAAVIQSTLEIRFQLLRVELPVLFASACLTALMIGDGEFTFGEAVICLICLIAYLADAIGGGAKEPLANRVPADRKAWARLIISPLFIFLGGRYTVESVVVLADSLAIGTEVVALSAVALGTSLPEVLVTVSAARRGNAEMAIGNIIGSNIFNSFAVLGIPGILGTLVIPSSVLAFSLPMFLFATLLAILIVVDGKVHRTEGALLLTCYGYFLAQVFGLA